MLRLSENPAPRWPPGRSLADDLGHWWVARVKPRNEKALAHELARMEISYYLPLILKRTLRRHSRKIRKSLLCAFPGYLALTRYPERKVDILRTGRVLHVIQVQDQEKFVRELDQVRRALAETTDLTVQSCLVQGRRAVIVSGPLQGVEGVITDLSRPHKIYLNVEIFNRAVAVMVPPDQLLPLPER